MSKGKLHILQVIRTLSGGGAELVVETLCAGLDRKRFDVSVCELVGHGERGAKLRRMGFEVTSLMPEGGRWSNYFNFLRLRRLVSSRGVHLLHSHCPASLADAALCSMIPPRVRWAHTFHFGNYPHQSSSARRLEKMFGPLADARVGVGHVQTASIRATYGWRDADIGTIWNGIPRRVPRVDTARLAAFTGSGKVVIGTLGTLIPQKGHHDLLAVAAALKQQGRPAIFLIVGDGPLRAELEATAQQLGVTDCVHFLGWVPDAAETVLPAVDIFFQPSRWEAMSMVLLEAAAAGKPIVCTAVGEAPRILEHGRSGFLVAQSDQAAMITSLEKLISDGALRARMGEAARNVVEARCMADAMVRHYEALYAKLLAVPVSSRTAPTAGGFD